MCEISHIWGEEVDDDVIGGKENLHLLLRTIEF
jgi:hypothetical protein